MNIREDIELLEDHARELRMQAMTTSFDLTTGVFNDQADAYDKCVAILQEALR
jgi:hypothetical protein